MKTEFALVNGTVYTGFETLVHHAVLVRGQAIVGVVPDNTIPESYEIVDVEGGAVCPGLVDLQIYGTGQHLFSAELTTDSIQTIERKLLEQGCTSFYLTLATNTLEVFSHAIDVFKKSKPSVALGLHLEGPFLNAQKRGAHPEELIHAPTRAVLQQLLQDANDAVKMITIAPEVVDDACLTYLNAQNVLVSAGHSAATAEEATYAFDNGVRAVTHLWNAMSSLHHRAVGLPGAAFNHQQVAASIIVDGIHVDYEAVRLSKAIMGERLFLITDAVASCDTGIYHHRLNGDHYVLPDGTLSGSALTLLQAVKNCVQFVGIPLDEAIRMATSYPADLIGRTDLGRIQSGTRANLMVFDTLYNVRSVYFEGHKVV